MNEEEKNVKEESTNTPDADLNVDNSETEKNKKEKKDRFKKEIDALSKENESLKEEVKKFKDKYYRAIADLDNQRKQYDKEYHQTLKYASQNLAEKLLPSFEMFSMVIESVDHLPSEVQPYVQGFDMVYRQMIQALESEGVSEIKVKVGDEFDHNIHSALETQVVEDESLVNKIIKVIRKGYKIHDRLLKPATVVVGKSKEEVVNDNVSKEETQAEA